MQSPHRTGWSGASDSAERKPKMAKLFKLLGNAGKIFKYLNIFTHVSNGLRIAGVALEVAVKELKESKPDFKYIETLESVISFISTAKETVDTFMAIFGIVASAGDVDNAKADDKLISDELKWIESEIKKQL